MNDSAREMTGSTGTTRTPRVTPRPDESGSESAVTSEKSMDSMERAKLLGYAGDPERTPDIPDDSELREATKTSSQAFWVRYCCLFSVLGTSLALVFVVAAPAWQRWTSSSPKIEWETFPASPNAAGGRAAPSAPLADATTPGKELCNAQAPLNPGEPLRAWQLGPLWRRSCEAKNLGDAQPQERNWCWIGIKQKCHWNLKAHFSWTTLQHMAAEGGAAPPVRDEPFHPLEHPELCDRPENGVARKFTVAENVNARAWFEANVATYVLNLPTDRERWDMVSARLQDLDIKAKRVSGVDMRKPSQLEKAKQEGWVVDAFNFSHAQEVAYLPEQNMGSILGTLGCAAAHFKAQATIIADGIPMGLVIEDDSWLADDFVPRLWSLVLEELPCDWQVVALYSRCPYGKCISPHLARVQPDANEPAWRCRQGVNWGMHAILYRTETLAEVQQLWKQTVFNEEVPHCMDVDVALASISDQVRFYVVPNVQDPGFVKETNHRSARWDINQAAVTVTTSTSTSFVYVPHIKPGEPWPGAWNFG